MLKVYWIGYGGTSHLAEQLRPVINSLGLSLVTIHEHADADIKWDLKTWKDELSKADFVVIPSNWKEQPAKSNNRLSQALSMGKPVVCSPLLAYTEIEEKYPGCCLLASSMNDWRDWLTALRDDVNFRKTTSDKALQAAKEYSIDAIGKKWADILKPVDKVDIVIPTYNNARGLKLCIDSIRACTEVPYNIIVVNNGTNDEINSYLSTCTDVNHIKTGRCNFAQAVNTGIKAGSSKYVMILNDDTICSRGWLSGMVSACDKGVGAVGLLSNCDKGWTQNYDISIGGVDLLPGVNTFDQIEPIISQIYDYKSPYDQVVDRDWVAFYCTLIPRAVINEVGYLNEEFVNSGEDVDLCKRIKLKGYRIVQTYKSFLYHFGAVSRKILEKEDVEVYQEADRKTQGHLRHLWGRKSVMVYSGPSWERWNWKNLEQGGIGGSEIWQIWVTRELSKLGYRVTSFADCPESGVTDDGGVLWLNYIEYPKWVDQHWSDYAILSRTTDPLNFPLRAGKIYVLSHDVWLLNEKTQTYMDKVTKYLCLSEWHRDFFSDYHKIPKDRIGLSSNGISFERFDSIDVPRDPYCFIWASSWDRGLDNVLYLWPFIKKEIPEANLQVYYGISNWKKSCERKNDADGLKKIAELEDKVKQDGITVYGRVGQGELARAYKSSSLLFYPGWFSETFFLGGIEAQRSGVPVIANKYAGLITTLGDSAILLGNGDAWYPYSKEGRELFLKEVVEVLTDNLKWKSWSEKGFKNSEKYSWENVALMWKKLFEE